MKSPCIEKHLWLRSTHNIRILRARRLLEKKEGTKITESEVVRRVLEKGLKGTSIGIGLQATGAIEPGPDDLGAVGNIAAEILGFGADAVDKRGGKPRGRLKSRGDQGLG